MRNKLLLTFALVIIFLGGLFIGKTYLSENAPSVEQEDSTTKTTFDTFVNVDELASLEVGDTVSSFVVTVVGPERSFSDGSKGKPVTFRLKSEDTTGPLSLSGQIQYADERDVYFLELYQTFSGLPILYSKNENGVEFLEDRYVDMNYESGEHLYEYWNSKDRDSGQVYLESFDITGDVITNLKVNPVSI